MMRKMLKSTTVIVLAIALIVTGFNVDMVSPAADINQKVTQKEFKITARKDLYMISIQKLKCTIAQLYCQYFSQLIKKIYMLF